MSNLYKTALVTGASSGIGQAVAIALRKAGMQVLAVGRSVEPLNKLEAEWGIIPLVMDVRDTERFVSVCAQYDIDVLINNAGVLSTRAAFHEIDPAEISNMIDINLTAPIHLTRHVISGMVERKKGHIFFIGSSAGRAPHPNAAVYGASKAGISLFCDALRCDLLGTGIRVSEIAPGRVETQLYRSAMGMQSAQQELYDGYESIHPEDIATLIMTAINLPAQVDVSRMEVFPTSQAVGGGRMVKTAS